MIRTVVTSAGPALSAVVASSAQDTAVSLAVWHVDLVDPAGFCLMMRPGVHVDLALPQDPY